MTDPASRFAFVALRGYGGSRLFVRADRIEAIRTGRERTQIFTSHEAFEVQEGMPEILRKIRNAIGELET